MTRSAPRMGKRLRAMYRHYDKYGTAGMTKRQLRLLAREFDVRSNPKRPRKTVKQRAMRAVKMVDRHHKDVTSYKSRRRKKWLGKASRARRQYGRVLRNRNPKRDGTPTRGENRSTKRNEWLKVIAQRGRDAQSRLDGLKSVTSTSAVAVMEHAPEVKHEAAPVVAQEVEHAEAHYIREKLGELTALINSIDDEIKEADLAHDDALAEELMEQKIKFAKQKTAFKAKAEGLGIRTNPRRSRKVLVGLRAYGRALSAYRRTLRARK